jgi:hypothetical protein
MGQTEIINFKNYECSLFTLLYISCVYTCSKEDFIVSVLKSIQYSITCMVTVHSVFSFQVQDA